MRVDKKEWEWGEGKKIVKEERIIEYAIYLAKYFLGYPMNNSVKIFNMNLKFPYCIPLKFNRNETSQSTLVKEEYPYLIEPLGQSLVYFYILIV